MTPRTSGTSDAAVREAAGHTWPEWLAVLEAHGAAKLPHEEIAAWLKTEHGVAGWWSQTITVEYERRSGRRARTRSVA